MKKLMIAAAIVCAAAVTQAATVQWNSGTMYAATDGTGSCPTEGTTGKVGMNKVVAYLYDFGTDADTWNAAKAMSMDQLYSTYVAVETKPTGFVKTGNSLGTGAANLQEPVIDSSGMHYGMVLYVDATNANIPDGKDAFMKVGFDSANITGTSGPTIGNLALQQAKWSAVTAVPEPTSGLLLLLGVAGLALRRRRA